MMISFWFVQFPQNSNQSMKVRRVKMSGFFAAAPDYAYFFVLQLRSLSVCSWTDMSQQRAFFAHKAYRRSIPSADSSSLIELF